MNASAAARFLARVRAADRRPGAVEALRRVRTRPAGTPVACASG